MKTLIDEQRDALLREYPHLQGLAEFLFTTAQSGMYQVASSSVVITCKNQSHTLPLVVDRLARQTQRPDLVVLSDDASTDNSVQVFLASCRAAGLPADIVAQPPGPPYRLNTVRNEGFRRSLDGLVLLIDGDVLASPLYVERHMALHAQSSTPIFSIGPRLEFADGAQNGPVGFMWGTGAEVQPLGPDSFVPCWQRAHGTFCLARGLWRDIGGFDESYNGRYGIDDLDLMFRLILAGVYPKGDFEAYVIHIPHPTTFSGGGRDPHANIKYFCEKYGVRNEVLQDKIDFSPLARGEINWATRVKILLASLNSRRNTIS